MPGPTGRKGDIAFVQSAARYRADGRLVTSRRSPMALAWRWCCAQTHSRARPKLAPLQPRVASAAERRRSSRRRRNGAQRTASPSDAKRCRWRCDCRTCASIVLGWFVPYAKTHARTSRLRLCSRTAAAEPHSRGIRSALAVGRSNGNRRVGALRCARFRRPALRARPCHAGTTWIVSFFAPSFLNVMLMLYSAETSGGPVSPAASRIERSRLWNCAQPKERTRHSASQRCAVRAQRRAEGRGVCREHSAATSSGGTACSATLACTAR